MNHLKNQTGQVLLITVMLLATVLTVVFAVSFKSTADTQSAKLEEESQKALAAAQAGIEEAIKSGNIQSAQFSALIPGFTGTATYDTSTSSTFVTPLLQQDEIYTFYLGTPANSSDQPDFSTIGAPYYSGSIGFCFGTGSTSVSALELTFLRSDGSVKKYLVDNANLSSDSTDNASSSVSSCPSGTSFTKYFSLSSAEVGSDKLLVIRVLGAGTSTKVGLVGSGIFKLQGKTIVSSATSSTGVTKKIELFQSYPQVPAEFFVTTL